MPEQPSDFQGLKKLFEDPHLERVLQKRQEAAKAEREVLARLAHVITGMRAEGLHALLIRDPADAERLTERHNRLVIAEQVVSAATSNSSEDISAANSLLAKDGGFMLRYTNEFVRNRIQQVADPQKGGWVVAASYGIPTRKDALLAVQKEIEGGDIQLWIPPDDSDAELEQLIAIDVQRGDQVFPRGKETWEKVQKNPAIAAWVADVCSERSDPQSPAFGNSGFASVASERAFEEAIALNVRRKNPLQWALAAIVEITHVREQGGKTIALNPTWLNVPSIYLHQRSRYGKDLQGNTVLRRSSILGEQVGREMEVVLPDGRKFTVIVNWTITAQELEGHQ
ncbi:hypothetical protein HY213_03825 [Candidatus Peregrinibacteria bacterium]|nr:hypothetical protein [Candidatus Peregrinibacteria bacterium]